VVVDERGQPVPEGDVRAGLDPADPQVIVAAAINDVIELARAMSATGLSRGVVEMRRRLHVMDAALAQAERAGVLQGQVEGNA
jgi:hypothetical protein